MSIELLINALYDPNASLPKESWFYQQILEERDFDAVASQLYYLLKHQGQLDGLPDFFKKELKKKYSHTATLNMFIKSEMKTILKQFEDRAITVIPIKGITFAERYFGHFAARPTSDIDLLIRESDLERAIEQLYLIDFTIEDERIPGHFHCSFSKPLPGSLIPLTVELHWNLLKESTATFDVREFWYRAKPLHRFQHIKQLSNEDAFYFMVIHGWRHNLDSLKYYLDIIQMIDLLRDDIDYERLLFRAEVHMTKKRMIRTLSMVYSRFPYLDHLKPFPFKLMKRYWPNNTLHHRSGIRDYINFVDYQFLSYDSPKHSLIEIKNWVVPSKKDIRNELGNDVSRMEPLNYFSLYKKRLVSLFKAIGS